MTFFDFMDAKYKIHTAAKQLDERYSLFREGTLNATTQWLKAYRGGSKWLAMALLLAEYLLVNLKVLPPPSPTPLAPPAPKSPTEPNKA